MVVGDRLWLFSQPPSTSQQILMNTASVPMRGFVPAPISPIAPQKFSVFAKHPEPHFMHRIPTQSVNDHRSFSDISTIPMLHQQKFPINKMFPNNARHPYVNPFSFATVNDTDNSSAVNGIAELEKAFGNVDKCNQLIGAPDQPTAIKDMNILKTEKGVDNESITDESEIDCEELDEA